ncbi:MAG: histidine phosphatase family protein [Deltaproteobacteria bacterium]|nr:histidine phosphatase family protein [Deltaproteobacteria bacterium]
MKTIYLLRHAKSSRDDTTLDDFERPLNNKGRESLVIMGKLLNDLDVMPDIIISSPASRAAMTARAIASKIHYPLDKISYREALYLSEKDILIEEIKNIKNTFKSVMVVGHNPGITDLANFLGDKKIDDIPTCGLCSIEFALRSWKDIDGHSGRIKFIEYPKKQRN